MARRFIAIDTGNRPWRLAVARPGKPVPVLERVAQLAEDDRPLAERIREVLGHDPGPDDRLALDLPVASAFVRWLDFPFAEAGKIRAALPAELARQLPGELDDRHVLHQRLAVSEGGRVLALAVPTAEIENRLKTFDAPPLSLACLAPLPFTVADLLEPPDDPCLLGCISSREIVLVLLAEGRPQDWRVQPRHSGQDIGELVSFITRQAAILAGDSPDRRPRLLLVGDPDREDLAGALERSGFQLLQPVLQAGNADISPSDMPVAALALAAARRGGPGLNALTGPYAPRREWRQLRPLLLTAGSLLLLSILLFAGAGWLQIGQRQRQIERLNQQMRQLYRQAFPGEKTIVDPLLQLEAKLRQLRGKADPLGAGAHPPLAVLREVSSRLPQDVKVRIRDYSHSADNLRLEGETTSFEAVSRLVSALRQSPLFSEVTIDDTKQRPQGGGVDFRLQLHWKGAS